MTTPQTRTCCGTSVGVIITDDDGRLPMVQRGWWPLGIAPVAGHVRDEHYNVADALTAEVAEEVGLTVTSAELAWEGRLDNLCASLPATPPGHHWWVFRATTEGELRPAEGETRGAAWYTPLEVEHLAAVTVGHARSGGTAAAQPARSLEAVWIDLLALTGDLAVDLVPGRDLEAVRGLYTTPPPEYYLGGRPKH